MINSVSCVSYSCLASAHFNLASIPFYMTHITLYMKSEEIKSIMYYFPKSLEILDTQLGCKWIWYHWPLRETEDYTEYHWFCQLNKGLAMPDIYTWKFPPD